jgi:alpha-galactosidase
MTFIPLAEIAVDPRTARVYEHGWQSWSPTRVYDAGTTSARPEHEWQHLMRFRPGTAPTQQGFQAEGLLVVDPGTGEPARLFAADDPAVDVPSIRAHLHGDRILVSADRPTQVRRLSAPGLGAALAQYGDAERERAGVRLRPAPAVWCSWYHYFLDVTEADIVENLEAFDRAELPVGVVQVDDGWQAAVGDWLDLSSRFSSIRDLAARIRDTGRRAGIWVAPFLVAEHSRVAKDHPDWLLGDAGTNWGGALHGLDLTHPAVRDYLRQVFAGLREAGYDYFKLDFLYAGALPGPRHEDLSAVAAYRSGLQLVRDAVGEDAYVLACGAPILPSVGLVDAMRVSPDTYNPDDLAVPGGDPLRGRPSVEARAWQQGRFWVNDADCLVARPGFALRQEWAGVVERYGGLRSFSDRVQDLDRWGLDTVRRLLGAVPDPAPFTHLPDPYQE